MNLIMRSSAETVVAGNRMTAGVLEVQSIK